MQNRDPLPRIVAIAGNSTCGKDLFADLIIQELKNPKLTKSALAEQLKRDCSEFLIDYCDVDDSFNPSDKSQIRPLWTWYGNLKRQQTKGMYFINALKKKIECFEASGVYNKFIITDLRFKEFDYDEYDFVRENKGVIVFIDKMEIKDGAISYSPPANDLEARNNPFLRQNCDFHIKWPDCHNDHGKIEKFCIPEVHKFLKRLVKSGG